MTLDLTQLALIAFAAATIITTGRKKAWGWLIGVASEGVWALYAWQIRSWGLAVLCVVYGSLYVQNWVRWTLDAPYLVLPIQGSLEHVAGTNPV